MDAREKNALAILREALDCAHDDRSSFVHERCGDDAELERRVLGLLAIAEAESAAGSGSFHGADAGDDPLLGDHLGPFRVIERIGRGGMGVVYRGEREEADFTQEAALKLIRRGFDFDDIRARFLRERRILARLDHPNLARFIDGGVATDGRPWFALEFVRGVPITAWCDARALGLSARVRLFLDVCTAVQYAHGQLVVHRDLKPANILVDGEGHVRLLDFGVARLLANEDNAAAPTAIGDRTAYTPEYAAPEQIDGGFAGVATDVYALGVVLYQLVTGVLPFELDRHDAAALQRALREQPPQPLVHAIARGGANAMAERLRARDCALRAYRSRVRGDLSRIVNKALAKDPAHRYASVQALAEDLTRWRAGAPVRVSGHAPGYRLRKFVARNRLPVIIAGAAALLLAALTGYHVQRLQRELRQTEAQRNRAQTSLSFLQDLLASPDPQAQFGPSTTLGEFLGHAYRKVTSEAGPNVDMHQEVGLTIASSLRSIQRYDDARNVLDALRKSAPASIAGWRVHVAASTEEGTIQTLQGRYADALVTLDQGRDTAQLRGVDDPVLLASLWNAIAIAHNHLAQWPQAIDAGEHALRYAGMVRAQHPALYAAMLKEASIPLAYSKIDLSRAQDLLRESLALQVSLDLAGAGLYLETEGELADLLADRGDFDTAEPLLIDVISRMRDRYGDDHRETAFKSSDLALLYMRWNRLDEARHWREQAGRRMTAALGAKHPFMALHWIQSADLAFVAGEADRAADDAARGAALADDNDRREFSATAELYRDHARCLHGDRDAFDRLGRRATAADGQFNVQAFHVDVAAARCFAHSGRHDRADAVLEPFRRRLAQGQPLPRTDYIVPLIEQLRGAVAASPTAVPSG